MKRGLIPKSSSSQKRVHCDMDTEEDPTIDLDAIPEHHFPLGGDFFNIVSYFFNIVKIHLRHHQEDLVPTKKGMTLSPHLWQHLINETKYLDLSLIRKPFIIDDSLVFSTVLIDVAIHITLQRCFVKKGLFLSVYLIYMSFQ
ncbi:hypothetical protein NPIL_462901 [Nephila pilipes]|uniref:Uncharacterized protein n=1 Tax=Nephila pilipes TaxID=299642 RepID=A0A8X6UH46_NEPPI|nr:hypothetical protein NPIL_462901 [Nephila pilipes]